MYCCIALVWTLWLIMVNLWWCFSLLFCHPYEHTALSQGFLVFSAVASQDRAIVADRRRVGSINRNWTNYKADVPLYDGGRTLLGGGLSVVLSLSFQALVFVSEFVFDCLVSLTLSGFLLPPLITMFLIEHFLHYYFFHQAIFLHLAAIYIRKWSHAHMYMQAHVYVSCTCILSQHF